MPNVEEADAKGIEEVEEIEDIEEREGVRALGKEERSPGCIGICISSPKYNWGGGAERRGVDVVVVDVDIVPEVVDTTVDVVGTFNADEWREPRRYLLFSYPKVLTLVEMG